MVYIGTYGITISFLLSVLRNNEEPDITSNVGVNIDCESLPSYTIASGLPSYEEALCQLEIVKK